MSTRNQDFETIVTQEGKSVTWYANTEITDAQTGERKNSFDAGTAISGLVFVYRHGKDYYSEGFRAVPDTKLYVSGDYSVSENDKFAIDGTSYEVIHVEKKVSDSDSAVFSKLYLRKIANEG